MVTPRTKKCNLVVDLISTPGTRFPRAVWGASSASACGVSPRHVCPAGVSYLPFQSTSIKNSDETLLYKKWFGNGHTPNQEME